MITLRINLDVSALPTHLHPLAVRRVSASSIDSALKCALSCFYADEQVRVTSIEPTNIIGEPLSFS